MKFKPSYKQLTIDAFRSSLDGLDKSNRWVWLGDHLPWEVYEKQYGQKLNNQNAGASAKPARMVIAAMIIKHATRLSDVDTVEMIRENPYMQYFCGLGEFTDQQVFDPSLFVDLRKRISEDDINEMTKALFQRPATVERSRRPPRRRTRMARRSPTARDGSTRACLKSTPRVRMRKCATLWTSTSSRTAAVS